jgi:3-phosphoshikimate 1-carboxyvinyltransferase
VHPSLAARSVEPFVAPLRARGAQIAGARGEQETPPISVAPLVDDERLLGLRCELPVSDDAAKTAVLISGLFSPHATTLSEPFVSADHTERLFVALGLPLRRIGAVLQLDPSDWNRRIPAQRDVDTTGCATCAAFLATAALLVPGSRIALANVGTNPSRAGFFDVLRLWGANAQVIPRGDANGREPTADVLVEARALRGGLLGGEQLVRARNELPALAALAAVTLRDLQLFDLDAAASAHDAQARNLEALLQAFGFTTSRTKNTLQVQRRPQPAAPGARIDAREDPELAMAAVVLGLTAEGETVIEHAAEALELTHPGFLEALRELGAEVELA